MRPSLAKSVRRSAAPVTAHLAEFVLSLLIFVRTLCKGDLPLAARPTCGRQTQKLGSLPLVNWRKIAITLIGGDLPGIEVISLDLSVKHS